MDEIKSSLFRCFCFLLMGLTGSASILGQGSQPSDKQQALETTIQQLSNTNTDSTMRLIQERLLYFERQQDVAVLCTAYEQIGHVFFRMNAMDSAMKYLSRGIGVCQTAGDSLALAKAYQTRSGIYYMQGDYAQTIAELLQSQSLYESLKHINAMLAVKLNIASTYIAQGQLTLADSSFQELLPQLDSIPEGFLKAKSFFIYGNFLFTQKKYEQAAPYLRQNLGFLDSNSDKIPYATGLTLYGENEGFLGNQREAMASLDKAEKIYTELGLQRGLNEVKRSRIHILMHHHQYAAAIPLLESNLEEFRRRKEAPAERNSLESLAIAYAGLGQYQKAYDMQLAYLQLKDSLLSDKQISEVARLTTQFETKKKENEILRLENQNKEHQLAISRQNRVIGWTVGGLALIGIFAFFLYRNNQIKRKANVLLEAKNEQLGQQNQEIEAQKSEIQQQNQQKETLLKEIHHRVKNNLQVISSLLRLQTSHIKDDEVRKVVAAGEHRVKSMALIHQKLYQRENLAGVEMKDYLRTLGKSLIDTLGDKQKDIHLLLDMPELEVDVDTAIPLGLIANELITNSLKYAFTHRQSGDIKLALSVNDRDMLELTVEDNGVGTGSISIVGGKTSFGSRLVHLLCMQLDGEVRVETEGGRRTKVAVKEFTVLSTSS